MLSTVGLRATASTRSLPTFMIAPAVRRAASQITVQNNPYKCKRTWPPDFSKLSTNHQFRLERRYKRRAQLAWARPTWSKYTKLAQWVSIVGVLIYGVLFMEVGAKGQEITPFDGVRRWYRAQISSLDATREGYSDQQTAKDET